MKKDKKIFVCQSCGSVSPKWYGKCPDCNEWNTFLEEITTSDTVTKSKTISTNTKPVILRDVTITEQDRIKSYIKEFDTVLGGGIVKGSLTLIGGEPGIGKSTLLLMVANNISIKNKKILYVSGEESIKQTKLRADRLNLDSDNLYIVSENNIKLIEEYVKNYKPELLIVDSIQTVYNPEMSAIPGSVSQVKEATAKFMNIAKVDNIATIIVGHVTKGGNIAGPKLLEHMVDTVLYFEGEKNNFFTILRSIKNRFGSTNEIAIFEMKSDGLKEVINPSELFLSNKPEASGSVVVSVTEGRRVVLVEIQSLVSKTVYNNPRRMSVGIDFNRLIMLVAIIEKNLNIYMQGTDVFVNVVGGMSLDETAVDLAVITSLLSSYNDKILDSDMFVFGEVGLTGEVRSVKNANQRIKEAKKLGFRTCILPKKNLKDVNEKGVKLIGIEHIRELRNILL